MAGGRIDIEVAPDMRGFDSRLAAGMSGPLASAGKFGKQIGLLLGVGSVAAGFKEVITVGNDFQTSLNQLTAVSGATADQISAVTARAKELGSDASIVGVSANDAAQAMTELAKGGFSVEQSMEAARGTLQLAGAAQIDAAQAATIQSQALQAFSLDASEASRVADILANTANASSAEITDVSAAMQQAGTVANQFGIDIDDTATAIGMFANAGITGSDAGTLLKTALLALTDQGKPAQSAMEELGLSVYDMQGRFVGLPALFDQLAEAQSRMSPEAYQAATSVLFGSDAMRLAGIAAQQGGDGFRELNDAINQTGGAAKMAEAGTQGLPGALAAIQNEAEGVALGLYDLVDGPLAALANYAADGLSHLPGMLTSAGDAAAGMAEDMSPLASVAGRTASTVGGGLVDAVSAVPAPVLAATAAMVGFRVTGLSAQIDARARSAGSALRRFGQDVQVQQRYAAASGVEIGRMNAALATLENRSPVLRQLATSYRAGAAPAQAWAGAQRQAASAAQAAALQSRDLFVAVDRVGAQAFRSASAAAGSFAGVLSGTARSAVSGLRLAAGGLFTALGGLPGLLTGGVAIALSLWAQKNADAAQKVREHQQSVDSMRGSLDQTTGAITRQTQELIANEMVTNKSFEAGNRLGIAQADLLDAALGVDGALSSVNATLNSNLTASIAASNQWSLAKSNYADFGVTADTVAAAMMGNADAMAQVQAATSQLAGEVDEFGNVGGKARLNMDELGGQLNQTGQDALKLSEDINGTTGSLAEARDGARDMSAALNSIRPEDVTSAMRLLGDSIVAIPDAKTVVVDSLTEDAQVELETLGFTVDRATEDGTINITAPNAMNVVAMLDGIGIKAKTLPGGRVQILDNTPEAMGKLGTLRIETETDRQGRVVISENSAIVRSTIDQNLNGHDTSSTHNVYVVVHRDYSSVDSAGVAVGQKYSADGGFLPTQSFAGGGLTVPKKQGKIGPPVGFLPNTAVIAAPQGARGLVQWAEAETDGEAFIPLAPAKRSRSLQIWAETGRRLGALDGGRLNVADDSVVSALGGNGADLVDPRPRAFADGGIMAAGLIEYAKGIEGKPYLLGGWGSGFTNTDCSGAQSLLANYVSGAEGRFATGNQREELDRRGFIPGPGGAGDYSIGWVNGGPAGGHTAGTLPNGVNVEMGGGRGNGQYGGGAAGSRDSQFTDHAHWPLQRFADLSAAVEQGAIDSVMQQLGMYDESALKEISDANKGAAVAKGTANVTEVQPDKPKTLSEIAGEFGKDLFSENAKDALSVLGKSDDFGPVIGAILALEQMESSATSVEEANRAAADARGHFTHASDQLEAARAEQAATEDPVRRAVLEAEIAKLRFDRDVSRRAESLALKKAVELAANAGPSDVSTSDVPTAVGAAGDGPMFTGLDDTKEVINYSPDGGAKQWRPLIDLALGRTGQSLADGDRTEQQMDIESKGDPKAQNNWDSNAAAGHPSMGLMQVIQPTYEGVKNLWPAHFTGLADDLLNPMTNIVAGIDACVNSWGSLAARWPTTAGYANGGMFMAGGTADRVAPSTFRVIGDRPDVDEFYLPDNNDPRTLAFGAEWADRRGFRLVRQDVFDRAGGRELVGAAAPSARGGDRNMTINAKGMGARDVVDAAHTIRRRERLEARREQR